jgi:hypothetical protein
MCLNSSLSAMEKDCGKYGRAVRVFGTLALVLTLSACRSQQSPGPGSGGAAAESGSAGPAAESKPLPRPRIDPRADQLLRQTWALLAATPRFAFEAEESFDEVFERAPRLQLTNVRRVLVEKPGRMATQAEGDTLYRAAWFDGKSLWALNKEENTYMTIPQPPTLDGALDKLAAEYGVDVPLSDFVYSDPYAVLSEGVLYGEYLGIHQAAGVNCHHLAFSQPSIDWQIWIDAGETPLPRKLVLSYHDEPGVPQYFAVIRNWNLAPAIAEGAFRFQPPQGARKVEPNAFRRKREAGEKVARLEDQRSPAKGEKP